VKLLPALLALALGACLPGSSDAEAATLALRYHAGDQQTYRFHEVFTGALAAAGGQVQAITFDLRAAQSTRVTAVDPDGTATLEVELRDVTGTSNGQPLPALGTQRYEMRVGPDGRVVAGGAGAGGGPVSVPSADQAFSILPDHTVKPGDAWTRDYQRPNPLAPGSLEVHSESRYLRDEQLAGVRSAVVETRLSTPVDQDLTVGERTLHETGTVSADVTTWLDAGAGRILKARSSTRFDLSSAGYRLSGSQTLDLERQA